MRLPVPRSAQDGPPTRNAARSRDDALRRRAGAVHADRPPQNVRRRRQLGLAAPRARARHAREVRLERLGALDDAGDERRDVAVVLRAGEGGGWRGARSAGGKQARFVV